MPKYEYKARDNKGNLVNGELEAPSEKDLSEELLLKGQYLISAKSKESLADIDILAPFKKVKTKELTQFTIELSTLLDSGLSLVAALEVEIAQMKDGMMKKAVSQVLRDIKQGKSFSESLAKHPKVFDNVYIGLIKAGEASGELDNILLDLASFMEKNDENITKVKSALIYPAIMLFVCLAICVFLLVVVLPSFKGIFDGAGVELPLPTRILLDLSDFFQNKWYIIIAGVVAIVVGIKMWIKTENGKYIWDGLVFELPVAGPLITKFIVVRFTSTFGVLVKSSVPMLQSFEILEEGTSNQRIVKLVKEISKSVSEGNRISTVVSRSKYFPLMVSRMIGVGEDTGALDNMLYKVSKFYEKELDAEIKAMTSLIEPLIVVIMGIVVGAIVLAVMLPMFDMIKLVG